MSFIEKYKPDSINDILGNKKSIETAKNWIKKIIKYKIDMDIQKEKEIQEQIQKELQEKLKKEKELQELKLKNKKPRKRYIKKKKKKKIDKKLKKCKFKNALLIVGPPGIGKTTFAHLLLKKFNFDSIEFNASITRTAKAVKEVLDNILNNKNILMMLQPNKLTGIIMDEIDGCINNGDRGGINQLIKTGELVNAYSIAALSIVLGELYL